MTKKKRKKKKVIQQKPLYKKWWFWVIIVLILGTIGNLIDPAEKESADKDKKEVPTSSEKVTKKSSVKESKKPEKSTEKSTVSSEKTEVGSSSIEKSAESKEQQPKFSEFTYKFKKEDEKGFTDFTLIPKKAKVYKKKGNYYLDFSFDWRNDSFPDKKTFVAAVGGIDGEQAGQILKETSESWADTKSDVYFPNAVGGSWEIKLTYQLVNVDDPVILTVVPAGAYDDNVKIEIPMKK